MSTPTPKVKDLIAALAKCDPEATVLLSLPGEPVSQTPDYVKSIYVLQPFPYIQCGPVIDGNVDRTDLPMSPAVALCAGQDRSQMIVFVGRRNPDPIKV
jgi:hypothetical protein